MSVSSPPSASIPAVQLSAPCAPLPRPLRRRFDRASFDRAAAQAGLAALLVAATLPLGAGSAHATSFTISANSSTAQTLGSGSGQTGLVNAGSALTVSGSSVAVAITGNNATLTNQGMIAQTGSGRAVRDNTGVSGLVVNNGSSTNAAAVMRTADADVIQMNVPASSVTLNNWGAMISQNASGGGAQAVDFSVVTGANTVNNYAGGLLQATEADAVRPGANGVVNNAGTIRSSTTTGSSSDGIDGQSNSGIQIVNAATGLVDGARHGITAAQASATTDFTLGVVNSAGGIIRGNNGSGINIDGVNGRQLVTIVNGGTIVGNGVSGDGDGVDVDGLVNITNTGTIRSVNAFSAPASGLAFSEGITVGGGTIVNSGTVEGLVAAGNTNAVGRGITLAGNDITSGPLAGTREGLYGNAVVTNQAGGLIRGQSDSAIVVSGAASGFTVVINNNAGATILGGGLATAVIVGNADNTTIVNAGTIDGSSSGKAIALGSGNNSVIVRGPAASIIGSIDGGSGGANTLLLDPGSGGQFAYAGSISNFHSVEVSSGNVVLSGQSSYTGSTRVSGGTLTLMGQDRIAVDSVLALAGGTLALRGSAGQNGQSFAGLVLEDNSALDLGFAGLTFAALGEVVDGKTLTVSEFSELTGYAFRFIGDLSNDADFLRLLTMTTIDHAAASFRFDGVYTDVFEAVPEPGTYALFLAGLILLGARVRRRGSPG